MAKDVFGVRELLRDLDRLEERRADRRDRQALVTYESRHRYRGARCAPEEMGTRLLTLPREGGSEIRMTWALLTNVGGHKQPVRFVQLRRWTRKEGVEGVVPTREGVTIRRGELPAFVRAGLEALRLAGEKDELADIRPELKSIMHELDARRSNRVPQLEEPDLDSVAWDEQDES